MKISITGIGTLRLVCLVCDRTKTHSDVPTDEQVMKFARRHTHSEPMELAGTPIRDDTDKAIENWATFDEEQPYLIKIKKVKKRHVPKSEPIEKTTHSTMYRICYSVETTQQSLTLDSTQRGRVASVLGKLQEAGANLSQLTHFEDWWKTTWRSKDKQGTYHPPRPEQVLEFWWVAMRAVQERQSQAEQTEPQTQSVVVDFEERMRKRAEERRLNNG